MRFPTVFYRYKTTVPAGGIALGADTTPPTDPPNGAADNLLLCKSINLVGCPVQRIAVGYTPPSGATTLSANIYIFDHASGGWYVPGTAKTLTPGQLTFFDVVAIVDALTTGVGSQPTSGGLEVLLIVADGAVAAGRHTFVMGADLSVTL